MQLLSEHIGVDGGERDGEGLEWSERVRALECERVRRSRPDLHRNVRRCCHRALPTALTLRLLLRLLVSRALGYTTRYTSMFLLW